LRATGAIIENDSIGLKNAKRLARFGRANRVLIDAESRCMTLERILRHRHDGTDS